jgi:hypothetical protein
MLLINMVISFVSMLRIPISIHPLHSLVFMMAMEVRIVRFK